MSDTPEKPDPHVEALYRQGSDEQPGAAADAAILALAAAAAAGRATTSPRSWARRWGAPMALAATVVMSIGIVTRIGPDDHAASGEVATGIPPASPLRPAEKKATADAVSSAPANTSAKTAADTVSRHPTHDAPPSRSQADKVAPMITQSAPPERGAAEPESPHAPIGTAAARASAPAAMADAARPATQVTPVRPVDQGGAPSASAQPAQPAPRALAAAPTQGMAMKRADVANSSAERSAGPVLLTATQESNLSVEAWLAYLLDLRRTGRHEAANTSLARFELRYPQVPLPDAVLGPGRMPSAEPR